MIFFRRRSLWLLINIFGLIVLLLYFFFAWEEISSSASFLFKKENTKIDWNDYELMKSDSLRTGFGEEGKGETLTEQQEIKENDDLFKTFGMSVVISDKISVNRSVPDFRHPDCLQKKYWSILPPVSIVIIFHNEIFSVFKRTLHSLYNRTPHKLIMEVILVNDKSTLDYLYDPLKNYIKENFADLDIKIINLEKRVGLMKARVAGAKAAKSEFIFIMEPHCEMTYNWLPPLIEPLLNEERVVTVPIVDNVEWKELEYYENDQGNRGCRGVFDWSLEYQKLARLAIEEEKSLDPFLTPIMTGGIFMIRKKYFFEIGPYDESLLIWGAENLEMSFKINLCGGKLLEVPCSRIGHLFRAFNKFRKHDSGIDFLHFNQKRIVEVWFDEFKDFVYKRDREKYNLDAGDLEEPMKLKEKLNCKPFKYFLDKVAPDLTLKFPAEALNFASGRIELFEENLCLEAPVEPGEEFLLKKCVNQMIQSQVFDLTWNRDIRLSDTNLCLDFYKVTLGVCHLQGSNQLFKYDLNTKQISNPRNDFCLESNFKKNRLRFEACDSTLSLQKWIWNGSINDKMLNNWKTSGRILDGAGIDIFYG